MSGIPVCSTSPYSLAKLGASSRRPSAWVRSMESAKAATPGDTDADWSWRAKAGMKIW